MRIRTSKIEDVPAFLEIYNHYVIETKVTFDEIPFSLDQMLEKYERISKDYSWLTCEIENEIVGFAYGDKWKIKSAYRFTAETTIYLDSRQTGKGIGTALYQKLLKRLNEDCQISCFIGGITLPNEGSIGLHEKLGFTKVAHFERVGFKFGQWLDVGYWQLNQG